MLPQPSRTMLRALRVISGVISAATIAAAFSLPAFAQATAGADGSVSTVPVAPVREEATQLDSVEVTGSRIRGVDLEKSQPIISVTRADLERTGITSLGDALSKLSVAGSALNSNVNNGGSGSTFVDLRSLGPQRTLVLVNGRRWVNDAADLQGSVDFATIPISIVERIEVLKDGASSLYGSDAIAGVINVITRKTFSGTQVSSQFGEFAKGDGIIESHSATLGSIGATTSALVDLSYTKARPVFAGDRKISKVPVFGVPGNDARVGSSTNPYGVYRGLMDDGATSNAVTRDRNAPNNNPPTRAEFRDFNPLTDGYNFAPINYLVTPSQRVGLFGAVRQELPWNIAFDAQTLYQQRQSSQVLAETPLVLGAAFGDPTVVSATNRFNPYMTNIGDDANEGVQKRLVEASGRRFNQDVHTFHLGAGLSSDFSVFDRFFNWDVGYIYNDSVNNAITNGQVNLNRVRQAVGPPAGCVGTEQPDPCVPLNLFGAPGAITPEMLNYILVTEQSRFEQTLHDYSANLSTPEVFQLPAGPLGIAIGYEDRSEAGSDTPDALVSSGATSGNARKPTNGGFSLREFYGEVRVPLLSQLPFVQALNLSLATRNSHYDIGNTSKSVTKSKAGLEYRPMDDLLLRVSYAQGFRAPSIKELFGGRGDNFPQITDVCSDFNNPDNNVTAAQKANCISRGVPADGSYVQANPQIKTTVGGEPNLQPEESRSLIYGAVYSPEFVRNLTLTVDVYRYTLDKAISAIDPQTVLDGCANTNDPFFCGRVTRNNAGVITQLVATNVNLGGAVVRGVDGHIAYGLPELFDGNFGVFKAKLDMTYIDTYEQSILGADGKLMTQSLAGRNVGDIVTIGGVALPRVKSNGTLEWSLGQWGASYTARYISEQTENCGNGIRRAPEYAARYCTPGFNQDGLASNEHTVDSIVYHDIQATYELPSYKTKFALGVNNFTDQNPPVSYSAFANSYDARTYDVPGAFGYVRATVNFD